MCILNGQIFLLKCYVSCYDFIYRKMFIGGLSWQTTPGKNNPTIYIPNTVQNITSINNTQSFLSIARLIFSVAQDELTFKKEWLNRENMYFLLLCLIYSSNVHFCIVNIVLPYTRIAIITSFYDSLAFTMFAPIIIIIVVVVSIIILTYVQY